MIGGVGCAILLCAALLIGGGAYYFWTSEDNPLAGLLDRGEEAPTSEAETSPESPLATATPVPTPTPAVTTDTEAEVETGEAESGEEITPTADSSEMTPTRPPEPKLGSITFALGATDTYEPVSPALSFQEGITEVHAIFEYRGMSTDYTWERVWYLDGDEILRSPQTGAPREAWSGAEAGVFDYFINNGGEPLPSGEWVLEIYVEGERLATGSFTIEGPEEAELIAEAEETEQATEIPPTSTPTPIVTATVAPQPSVSGGGTYQLVYTKWDGGQHNLYVADTNGDNDQFLANRAAGPSWTPDGATIFFYGEAGVDRQIRNGVEYVFDGISNGIVAMNASPLPTTVDQLTLFQALDWKQGTARWANVSPDGKMVAFDAKPGGNYRIYFLGTADTQQFRFEIVGEQADWSPDSQKIVYRSGRDGQTGIWISNRDDSGHTLTSNNASDSFPAWSPDGNTIAFSRDEGGNVDIYIMNVDGTNVQRLTETPGPDTLPTYTPSGDIIFRSARTGSWGIWKMSGTGANQQEIIPNAGVGPDWSFSKMDVN